MFSGETSLYFKYAFNASPDLFIETIGISRSTLFSSIIKVPDLYIPDLSSLISNEF